MASTQPQSPESYVSPERAAEFLSLPRESVIRMARAGKLPAHPITFASGRKQWRFKLSELDRHMQGGLESSHPLVRQ
jgi:excisionase family DNA binding protein